MLQSAVNISWIGGPLDIVCNGAWRLSCGFEKADIDSPAQRVKSKGKKREGEGRGNMVQKNKLFPDKT